MKKKAFAGLALAAVLAASIVGVTACGGGVSTEVNPGEEVTAEQWEAAFEASRNAENYTVEMYRKHIKTQDEMTVDYVATDKGYISEKASYSDGTVKISASNVPESLQGKYKNEEYKVESYALEADGKIYSAKYDGAETEADWEVSEKATVNNYYFLLRVIYSPVLGGAEVLLSELYSSFTYENGVYTAELYNMYIKVTVKITIKNGYVASYSAEYYDSYTGRDGEHITDTDKTVYNFLSYGTTTVNPSRAAKDAIVKYRTGA